MKATKKATIFLVDDHEIVRHGLAQMIAETTDLTVCGEAGAPAEALQAICRLKPDLVVVDISLGKDISGLSLIEDIQNQMLPIPILVHSMHDEWTFAERSLQAGAKGYIMKEAPKKQVIEAIRRLLAGKIWLSEQVADKVLSSLRQHTSLEAKPWMEALSDRELQVFQLIGRGETTHEIAESLLLSPKTIETYRTRIREKLELKDGAELLKRAIAWGKSQDLF